MTSRRTFLAGGSVAAGISWVAPSILTLDRVAAANGSGTCDTPSVASGAVLIAPPAVNPAGSALDSNTNTWVWPESGPCILANDLAVNRTSAGSFFGNSNEAATIPAGTCVCSHFVHGDRLDNSGTLTGSLSFGTASILGLIYRRTELNSSDFLGAPATTYTYGPMDSNDEMGLSLAPGANSLKWSMRFGAGLDQIRVITSCI